MDIPNPTHIASTFHPLTWPQHLLQTFTLSFLMCKKDSDPRTRLLSIFPHLVCSREHLETQGEEVKMEPQSKEWRIVWSCGAPGSRHPHIVPSVLYPLPNPEKHFCDPWTSAEIYINQDRVWDPAENQSCPCHKSKRLSLIRCGYLEKAPVRGAQSSPRWLLKEKWVWEQSGLHHICRSGPFLTLFENVSFLCSKPILRNNKLII